MKDPRTPDRLYLLCALIGAANLILFCAAAMALLRVLRAAARDAYNNPRRRLLELDDGVARRGPGKLCALCSACWPWTTQKALLAMVAFAAALRVAWSVIASHSWDAARGFVRTQLHDSMRAVFYSLDFFEAAATFTLFTVVARFWAELASAARQGTLATRPLGGGDEYRPRGTSRLLWKVAYVVQRLSCAVAYAAAAIATVLQASVWSSEDTYVSLVVALFESAAYVLAALVLATFAHRAIVELSDISATFMGLGLVPIELPTRRRRVFRITAVTVVCAACLFVRAGILVWAVGRMFPVNNNWDVIGILAYYMLLEALPLTVVLVYNRTTPLSASRPLPGRAVLGRRRLAPEEQPLMVETGQPSNDDINPFNQTEIPRAVAHR